MTNQETIQHCDHAEYDTIRETICGMRNKEYTCKNCGRTFGSTQSMQEDAKANRPQTPR